MNLISLEEAKAHLLMDHSDDDTYIEAQVAAASGGVLNYLKGAPIGQPERDEQGAVVRDSNGDIVYMRDSSGDLIVRFEIKAATMLLLGHLYKDRDENADGAFDAGYLPKPVTALLYPLRDPAVS